MRLPCWLTGHKWYPYEYYEHEVLMGKGFECSKCGKTQQTLIVDDGTVFTTYDEEQVKRTVYPDWKEKK